MKNHRRKRKKKRRYKTEYNRLKHLYMPTPMSQGYEDVEQMPMSPFPLSKVAAMPLDAVDYILQHSDIRDSECSMILTVIWGKLDYDNTEHVAGQHVVAGWTVSITSQDIAQKIGMTKKQVAAHTKLLCKTGVLTQRGLKYRINAFEIWLDNIRDNASPVIWQAVSRGVDYVVFAPIVSIEDV